MMPSYPILCYSPGCTGVAVYKIAACWSDGATEELKTYALSCEQCLADHYLASRRRQAGCHLAPGETLDPPGIYRLEHGQRDRQLRRLPELELELANGDRRSGEIVAHPADQ